MPWMVKPYSHTTVGWCENAFGILVSHFGVLLSTMEQRPRVKDIVFTCLVLHMLRTHQGTADRAQAPANDVAAQQNKQGVYVPNENYRNPSRIATHQREGLIQTHGGMGWAGGKDLRYVNRPPWGQKLASISPF